MTGKIKIIILSTLLTLITASIGITALISNIFKGSTIYIMLSSLVIIIVLIGILDIGNINLKDLIKNPIIKLLSIIFLSFSIIYYLSILSIMINNLFYVITPITIILSTSLILIIMLSINKKIINLSIFFVLCIIISFIFILFTFLFPKSNLLLETISIDSSNIYLYSYIILLVDLIYYKIYFSTKPNKKISKMLIYSSIIAIIVLSFYTYLDLTITNLHYTNTPFRNLLKYLLVLPNNSIYFDLLYLIIVYLLLLFKILIFGDLLRIFILLKKNIKNFFLIYLFIFLVGNTMINLIKDETNFLYNFLSIMTCISILIIFVIGGVRIAKRIYFFNKK